MNYIAFNTEFEISDNLVFEAFSSNNENVGTLTVEDGAIIYFDIVKNETIEFKDNCENFNKFVKDNKLTFRKSTDRKWVNYNPNPKGKHTGDCSIRAYCKIANMDWNNAYNLAADWGRKLATIPVDRAVVHKILNKHFKYEFTKMTKADRMTVNQFAIQHKTGTYVLWVRGHVVAVINGHYYDSWDCGDRKIYGVYEKCA